MIDKLVILIFSLLLAACGTVVSDNAAPVKISASMTGKVSARSWWDIQNEGVVRQRHEFSCGAAALATLLTYYYGIEVSEKDIIDKVNKDAWLSLADLKNVLPNFGMKGIGLALSYQQLAKLKLPVIVYVEKREGPHFAVLRGLTQRTVWVADPAIGNNKYPLYKFREKWEVRPDSAFQGKILVVLPAGKPPATINHDYFINTLIDKPTAQKR